MAAGGAARDVADESEKRSVGERNSESRWTGLATHVSGQVRVKLWSDVTGGKSVRSVGKRKEDGEEPKSHLLLTQAQSRALSFYSNLTIDFFSLTRCFSLSA